MPHSLIPFTIKPHLVPFLFNELKLVETKNGDKKVSAAKVTCDTVLGRIIRLLLKPTDKKPLCDISHQTFLLVHEQPITKSLLDKDYPHLDGRSSFLYLPKSGEEFINAHLDHIFKTAHLFYIHSWSEKKGDEGIDIGIVKFLSKYNLEEFNFNISRIRRDYYRKRQSGYFDTMVFYNPISNILESA